MSITPSASPDGPPPAIAVEAVRHTYPARRRQPALTALDGVSLTVPAGGFTILAGPNGSGKSTLFRLLCGTLPVQGGRIAVAGHDLTRAPAVIRAALGVVFQSPALDKHLTVRENLMLHGRLYGLGRRTIRDRLDSALEWSGIADRLDVRAGALSGGQQRQAELVKVLLTRPQVLVLDEPTTGLDPIGRRAFLAALQAARRQSDLAILMTTHVFTEAEAADHVAILRNGRLVAQDTPAALRRLVGTAVVVVTPVAGDTGLADAVAAATGHTPLVHGGALHIDDPGPGSDDAVALVDRLLRTFRTRIAAIAIKQPDLEDVFIHLARDSPNPAPAAPVDRGVLEAAQ